MSTGKGTPLGAAAVIINLANIFFMSPGYMLVVSMEEHLRDNDQHKMFLIWLIVLYLQLSAIGVFIINLLLSLINFSSIVQFFKNINNKKQFTNKIEQATQPKSPTPNPIEIQPRFNDCDDCEAILLDDQDTFEILEVEKQKVIVSHIELEKPLKIQGDIYLDGSKPHDRTKKHNKALRNAYSILISCSLIAFGIVYLRPDLFPFFKYSSVYSLASKTFPEKKPDTQKKIARQPSHGESIPAKKVSSGITPPIHPPKIPASDYWYIIKLKSGETIFTQEAVITRFYISVLLSGGQERRINKADLKSYVRKKIQ